MLIKLSSPFVVAMYGVCEIEHRFHLVMELLAKGSLFDHLKHKTEDLSWERRLAVSKDILLGVKFLHSQKPPVIHRDIKSLNVLLTENWVAKITDFGLAEVKQEIQSTVKQSSVGAGAGRGCGSLPWMAPELFNRHPQFGIASDIYATGMVFAEIATRDVPFHDAADPLLIPGWINAGERVGIPSSTPMLYGQLIEQMWKQNPADRPNTSTCLELLAVATKAFHEEQAAN